MTITKKTKVLDPVPNITGLTVNFIPVEKLSPSCDFRLTGEGLSKFNAETGGSTASITFTEGARAGTTIDMPYTEASCSPRYDDYAGYEHGKGIFIAQPNIDLVAGEKGTITVTIGGKASNAFPFEVAAA